MANFSHDVAVSKRIRKKSGAVECLSALNAVVVDTAWFFDGFAVFKQSALSALVVHAFRVIGAEAISTLPAFHTEARFADPIGDA